MKKIIPVIIGLVLVIQVNLFGQQVGDPAPDFEVDLLDGSKFKLSDHQGKVVFIFLFGNTCPSCIVIGPTIESSINQAYKENPNFTAIGLDTWNNSSSVTSVTGFRDITGISFPLAIKSASVANDYSTTYDRLMVIDHQGVLVHKGIILASNDVNNAIEAIEQSLAAMPTDPCDTAEINIAHVVTPPSCDGESDGSIDISVTGTNPTFTYSWSTGSDSEDIMDLAKGVYNVNVSDSKGCSEILEITVDEPQVLSVSETVFLPTCTTDSIGSINIDISGGTEPYQISWSNGFDNDSLSGLTEGCYIVEVTDVHECMESKNLCIAVPEPLHIELTKTDNECYGSNTGSLSVQVSGGTPPYQTILSDQEFQNMIGNLSAGEYFLNVIDADNCMTNESITISEQVEIPLGEITGPAEVDGFQTYTYSVSDNTNTIFHWSVAGGTIILGQGTHTVNIEWNSNNEGLVEVLAESGSGCKSDTTKLEVNIQSTTSVTDHTAELMSIYPNPAENMLYVSTKNEVVVSIFDITGQLKLTTSKKRIDMSALSRGTYFVTIRSEDVLKTERIIKL